MGPYGSSWVHIEGIRSHGCYKGSDIPNRDLVCYIKSNLSLDVGFKTSEAVFGKIFNRFPKSTRALKHNPEGYPMDLLPTNKKNIKRKTQNYLNIYIKIFLGFPIILA